MRLCFLLLLSIVSTFAIGGDSFDSVYSVSLNVSTIVTGQALTVAWSGPDSSESDWIAPFLVGACDDSSVKGGNTCYLLNSWVWLKYHGGNQHGSWNYIFDSPGKYEFRILRCECLECKLLSLWCSKYPKIDVSPQITVKEPVDVSKYHPIAQFIFGILYVEFQRFLPNLSTVMKKAESWKVGVSCSGCECDVLQLYSNMQRGVNDFQSLTRSFSMSGFRDLMLDLSSVLKSIVSALGSCLGIDTGIVSDLMKATALLVPGLAEVVEIINVAIGVEKIYNEVANIYLSFKGNYYFSAGINFAHLINTVISLPALHSMSLAVQPALASSTFMSSQEHCVMRKPGGEFVACDCYSAPVFETMAFKCRSIRNVTLLTSQGDGPHVINSPQNSSSDWDVKKPTIWLVVGSGFVGLALIAAGIVLYRRKKGRQANADVSSSSLTSSLLQPSYEAHEMENL